MLTTLKNLFVTPVMGVLTEVENTNRKPTEATRYYALKVETATDLREFWLLLTKKEVDTLTRVDSEIEGLLKQGRIYQYRQNLGGVYSYLCRISMPTESSLLLRLPSKLIKCGANRAQRNLEDIPDQSWLSDLFD